MNVINWFQTQKRSNKLKQWNNKRVEFYSDENWGKPKQTDYFYSTIVYLVLLVLFVQKTVMVTDTSAGCSSFVRIFSTMSYLYIYEIGSFKNICNEIMILTESMIKQKIVKSH